MSNLDSILTHLAGHYIETFPIEALRVLEQQNLSQVVNFVKGLDAAQICILFDNLNPHLAGECLKALSREKANAVLADMSPEKGATILRLFSPLEREKVLSILPIKISRTYQALIHYPPGSAGSLMDSMICEVAEDLTVGEAKKLIKKFPKQDFIYLYIVNRDGLFQGKISFFDFLKSDDKGLLSTIQRPALPFISADASSLEIVSHTGWQEYPEIPVLDEKKRILGVLHYRILDSLRKRSEQLPLSPIPTLMHLGETSWVGMAAAYQNLWGIFQEFILREKRWLP